VVPDASVIGAMTLTMEAAGTFETPVNFSQTTQCNIPEDSHLRQESSSSVRIIDFLLDVSAGIFGFYQSCSSSHKLQR
jgi:hypothetical protein